MEMETGFLKTSFDMVSVNAFGLCMGMTGPTFVSYKYI